MGQARNLFEILSNSTPTKKELRDRVGLVVCSIYALTTFSIFRIKLQLFEDLMAQADNCFDILSNTTPTKKELRDLVEAVIGLRYCR